ncbi:MAG: PAS domain-containing protein, partial [Gemmataceae bacterium]
MTATERPPTANGHAAINPAQRLNDLIIRLSLAVRAGPDGELTTVRDELVAIATDLRPLQQAAERSEQLEQAVRVAQDLRLRYQELFDFAPDGFVVTDHLGQIVEANHEAAALLCTPKEFLIGKPLACFIANGWRTVLYDYLTRPQRDRGAEEWQTLLQPRRGKPRHTALTVAVIADDRGGPACYRWNLRDLTAQKSLERTARVEKTLVDSIVETLEAVVLILDDAGRITRCNPFLERLAGFK